MTPTHFPESNINFGPPENFAESQVRTVPAYTGQCEGGSCDGQDIVVVAWQPNEGELAAMQAGRPVFMTMFSHGALVPHMLTTDFHQATHPA